MSDNKNFHVWAIIAILLSALLLAQNNMQKAFAINYETLIFDFPDATYDECEPITNTSVGGVIRIWAECGTTSTLAGRVFVFSETGTHIANITVASNDDIAGDYMLPCIFLSCVLLYDSFSDTIHKYSLTGTTLTLSGSYNPAGCTISGNRAIQYDSQGYIWLACQTEDTFNVFNPSTMTQVLQGPDLTTGLGTDCDGPQSVSVDYSTGSSTYIGVINCSLVNERIVTFTFTTWAFGARIEAETVSAVNSDETIFVDSINNRIIKISQSVGDSIDSFTYANDGTTITPEVSNLGLTNYSGTCYSNTYVLVEQGNIIICPDSTTDIVDIFLSNSTSLYHVASTSFTSAPVAYAGSLLGTTDAWVTDGLQAGAVNILHISGLSEFISEPPSPNPDDGGTPADCNSPFVDIDSDGDCDNPAFAGGGGQNVTDIGEDFFCQLGIIPCANGEPINPDIKTNGLGYLLYLIVLIVFLALATMAVEGKKTNAVHVMLYVIVIIGSAGLASALGWIDQMIFYVSILAVIALASTKLTTVISGQLRE